MENQPQQLDQAVVNLTKAIRQTETGGDFKAQGKSGEYGGYQFTEPTWQRYSKQYNINVPLKNATPEQQNAVAYNKIKEWKDKGHDVTEIAAMWNAGEDKPDAYKYNIGVDKQGVKFNTPAYAESVAKAYLTLKSGGNVGVDPNNPSSITGTQMAPEQNTYGAWLPATGEENLLQGAGKAAVNVIPSAFNLAGNIGSALLHPIRTIKGVGDVISGGVEKVLDKLGVTQNIETEEKQKFEAMVNALKERYGGIENIKKTLINDPTGAALDIATILEGGGFALKAAGTAGKTAEITSGLSKVEKAAEISRAAKAGELGTMAKTGQSLLGLGHKINPVEIITRGISKGFDIAGNKLVGKGTQLEIENLRMTPVQQVKYGAKVPDILEWSKTNGLNKGSMADRYAKTLDLLDNYESTLNDFLTINNTAKNIFINKGQLIDDLNKLKNTLSKDSSDALLIQRQIQSAIDNIGTQYRGQKIPIARLNNLKRSTWENAYNVGGDKVLNWVEHDIASIYKNAIEKATKNLKIQWKGKEYSIDKFNREYGIALTAKKLLKTAASRPEINFLGRGTGRIAATYLAEKFGGIPGAVLAYLAEPAIAKWLGGTKARSLYGKAETGVGGILTNLAQKTSQAVPTAGNVGLIGNLIQSINR